MKFRGALACFALAFVAACAGTSDDATESASAFDDEGLLPPRPEADPGDLPPEPNDAVSQLPWVNLGTGVNYKHFDGGTNVVAIYGGYTAQDDWVERWSDQIYRQRGAALNIGHLYAVRGPNTAGYTNKEIQNSKLIAHLASGPADGATDFVVIAHSSGTYVADEMFGMLKAGRSGISASTIGKVRLFNLDGGGVSDATLLKSFARAYFVYACDRTINKCSHNAGAMESLGQTYAAQGGAVEVIADHSGCDSDPHDANALWCMHDTLINTRPHNPSMYDLKWDYGDFTAPRALVTSYLDQPL